MPSARGSSSGSRPGSRSTASRPGVFPSSSRRSQSAVDRLASGERLLGERARNLRARFAEVRGALERAESRAQDAADELDEAARERAENRAAQRELRARGDAANERVRAARASRRAAEDALSRAQGSLRALQRERDAASVALAKARDGAESARVQDELFSKRLDELEESAERALREADGAQERLDEAGASLEAARADEAARRAAVEQARRALTGAQQADGVARRALESAQAQAAGLEQAARAGENAAPLAGRLAQAPACPASVARVSEVLEVPSELAPLVEHLLAGSLAGFVVRGTDGLASLAEAAAGLAGSSGGQVELLDCGAAGHAPDGESRPGVGFELLDRIGVRPGYEAVARMLLGGVRVVETVGEAVAASAADPARTYATPQGYRAFGGGRAVVGSVQDATDGLLERRRRLRELQAQMPELERAAQQAHAAVEGAEAELAAARGAHEGASQLVARLNGESASLSAEVARLRRVASDAARELERIRSQREEASRRAREAREASEREGAALEDAERRIAELDEELGRAQDAFDAARREDRAAHDEASSCQLEHARVQERAGSLESRCARLQREVADLAAGLQENRTLVGGLERSCARLDPLAARYAALGEAARERAALLRERAGSAERDAAALRKSIEAAKVAVADATVAHNRSLAASNDVKVEKGRLDVQVDNAVKAISSLEGVVLEEALRLPPPEDRPSDERELKRLEGELAQIGPVNQVAFEEYENLKRRADYIGEQVEDLQHARGDLTKILQAIDRKMKASFLETFKKVNENFEEIFSMLFPGGNGHLEMTEPDDPAATGIEVVAQPRGKRVTKMSLLSGGERSLTALGLLFAVYRTRTVPFYVLDEVEAALDDSNLDRLLAAIEVLRTRTQLIVISHQRRTMESADVLYGVSMQADGVSRVVSQKLERALADAS